MVADEEDSNDVVLRVSANAMGIAKPIPSGSLR